MAKIAKNSELNHAAYKTSLCKDAKEAWIEISSWRYDGHFLQLANIYFADIYKNTNELSLNGTQIRERFLKDFSFRKSLILFGQEKWLWIDNREVRNVMTHQMNFEWESIDDIKQNYSSQIKQIFFEKKKSTEDEVSQKDDPILSLLKGEDKKKVILSKKYEGNIKTFTRLSTILCLADAKQQKDIIKYLVPNDLQSDISLEWRKEIIDITWANSIYEIINRDTSSYVNEHKMREDIISYIMTKNLAKDISPAAMVDIIKNKSSLFYAPVKDIDKLEFAKFLIEFLEWIGAQEWSVDKDTIEALELCLSFFWKNNYIDTIYLHNKKIDIAFIEKKLKSKDTPYEITKWIKYLKEYMEWKKTLKKYQRKNSVTT